MTAIDSYFRELGGEREELFLFNFFERRPAPMESILDSEQTAGEIRLTFRGWGHIFSPH